MKKPAPITIPAQSKVYDLSTRAVCTFILCILSFIGFVLMLLDSYEGPLLLFWPLMLTAHYAGRIFDALALIYRSNETQEP